MEKGITNLDNFIKKKKKKNKDFQIKKFQIFFIK